MKLNLSILVITASTICSCIQYENRPLTNPQPQTAESIHNNETKHWTYEGETGPEYWTAIEKQSDCGGLRQSPINIIDIDTEIDKTLISLNLYYSNDVKIHNVNNNGHTIQYNFEQGDYILLNDEKYNLKQIHFHEASEHTINGVRYPLEMHMVHLSEDSKIAVLGIMAIEGESSEPFTFLEHYLPIYPGETATINSKFDLNLNLPKNKDYYTYNGSLTTPPCSETVQWFIFKNPISISLEQVKLLKALMPLNNYRNEQPLNNRIIKQFKSL